MKLLDKYWKPTPKKWRLFGDSLLVSCMGAVNYVATDHTMLRIVVTGMIIGKFLSNLSTENN